MSLGMFCAIPLPGRAWDDRCAGVMLACFPLVGAIVGALWLGLAHLLASGGMHIMLASAALAVFPFCATGFLHLDGYMDTSDAVLSRRPLEEKLRILKDPHAGAFAVIMAAVLFILQFSAVYAVFEAGKHFALLAAVPVLSRCGAAMSTICLKTIAQSGYANMFRQAAGVSHKLFLIALALAAAALSFVFAGFCGLFVAAAVILGHIAATACAYRDLKGMSGDIAGFALVISELCGLIALAVCVGG